MLESISNLIIPLMVLGIIIYALFKKVNIYDEFIIGASESIEMIIKMFPCILAMLFGVNIFINSNILFYIFNLLKPIIKIPLEIIPMALMRPISGTSSLAILNNIYKIYGPDTLIGNMASIIQGSTDTTFYIVTLYFGSIGVKKIRYALKVGLIADLIGITSAIIIAKIFF